MNFSFLKYSDPNNINRSWIKTFNLFSNDLSNSSQILISKNCIRSRFLARTRKEKLYSFYNIRRSKYEFPPFCLTITDPRIVASWYRVQNGVLWCTGALYTNNNHNYKVNLRFFYNKNEEVSRLADINHIFLFAKNA